MNCISDQQGKITSVTHIYKTTHTTLNSGQRHCRPSVELPCILSKLAPLNLLFLNTPVPANGELWFLILSNYQ